MNRILLVIASLLLLTSPVRAEDPSTFPESNVQQFLGLDDTSAPTQVQDGRAQDIQNVNLGISRDIRKRYGSSLIVTVGSDALAAKDTLDIPGEDFCSVTGIYYTKFSSGTESIVSTCGGRFYKLNGTSSWDRVFPIVGTITAGQNNQFVFTTALDNIILTNNVDAPLRYDNTTLSLVNFSGLAAASTPSRAKTVAFFKNYLIFGNTSEAGTAYPTRIRFSNVGTINTWSNNDYIDIGALGGQSINCMAELYDSLFIGLDNSIYKISLVGGAETFQVAKVTDDIGCIAKNSVQSITLTNAQNGLIFLDKDSKVYFYNGSIAQDISPFIQTAIGNLADANLQYAVSADNNTDYVLCARSSTGSGNDTCLDFQYQIGEWTKHTNITANAMAHVSDSDSTDQIYWGSYDALVYKYQDTDLNDVDVGTTSPVTFTVDAVNTYTTATASGLIVLYDSAVSMTTGALVGAPIKLVGGTGSTQINTIADNTTTGIIVTDTFSTTPDTTTTLEVGGIDSYYTTKWYHFGTPTRIKHFGEVYFWSDADSASTINLSYAFDFQSDISTIATSLAGGIVSAVWGTGLWGTSVWSGSGTSSIFSQNKLDSQGRYIRFKFADDDPGEWFHVYCYSPLFWIGESF